MGQVKATLLRPLGFLRRRWKLVAGVVALGFVLVNVLAARHAKAFLTYAPAAEAVVPPEQLSTSQKLGLLFTGVSVPRPVNASDPRSLGMPFETHRIELGTEWLELWHVPCEKPRGVAILFPGYSASKSSLLTEAIAFRDMGFDVLLVDFRGVGGSSGSETTLGVREAEDVRASVQFAEKRWPNRRVVLFGRSMGAAAVLRAVAHLDVKPVAIVIECPFDRMLNAVRNRFAALSVPSFPGAQLLVLWGGQRLGFDGFAHNPTEYAAHVNYPTLVLAGSIDTRATTHQVREVFDRLNGPKRIHIFEGVGHESFRAREAEAWDREVREFLAPLIP